MLKQQREAHKFRCPTCGNTTSTPLRATAAVCAKTDKHPSKATVQMKEVPNEPASVGD